MPPALERRLEDGKYHCPAYQVRPEWCRVNHPTGGREEAYQLIQEAACERLRKEKAWPKFP